MAYTKAQLEAIKNTLLESNQPILASQHRGQIQSMIDEMYDPQSRGNILVGVQSDTVQGGSDTLLIFRSGQAYQIPLSLFSATTLAGLGDVFISDVQNGDSLVYNLANDRWENQNILLEFAIFNLSDVELTSLTNGDILRYDSTSEKWENESLATILSLYALLTDLDDYQLLSEKGQANGYAQLDTGAKIPISIIPDSVLGQVEYQGTWNASTNTPTLPSTPVKKGDYYVVSVGGPQFGIDFLVGDWIISNGLIWEKVNNTDAVTSVFGRLGNVVANASDYSAFYVTLDTTQTITGAKTFSLDTLVNGTVTSQQSNISADGAGVVLQGYVDNNLRIAVRGSGYNDGTRGGLFAQSGDFAGTLLVTGAATFSNTVLGTSAVFSGTVTSQQILGTSAVFSGTVTSQQSNISADGAGVVLQGYVDNNLRIAVRGSGYNDGARGGLFAQSGDFAGTLLVLGAATFSNTVQVGTRANATGNFATYSATGVLQERTASEVVTDLNVVTIDTTQTITGAKTFSLDTLVSGLTIGRGGGNVSTNTANGYQALFDNTTGFRNTANGSRALYSNTTAISNTANGSQALFSNTTGSSNTANGSRALYSNTTAFSNTANGSQALFSNTTGSNNTANGSQALYSNTTAISNTANGSQALFYNTTGSNNTANGSQALFSNTTAFSNTANGSQALFSNTAGSNNTANGYDAGRYIADKSTAATILNNSIMLGYRTSPLANNQTNQIVIGYDAIGEGSNTTVIGNSSTILTRLYGDVSFGGSITAGSILSSGQIASEGFVKGNSGTGTVLFDWNQGNFQTVTLTGSCTFVFSGPFSRASYQIIITQDGTGGRTVTWPTIHWEGKAVPSLTGTANSVDVVTLTYDGDKYLGVMAKNFGTP